MNRNSWTQWGVFILLVGIGVAGRLAADRLASTSLNPAWYAIASVCGPTLFAGFYLSKKWLGALVPLAIMATSDYFLQLEYLSSLVAIVTYAAFAAPVALGWVLRHRLTPLRMFSAAAGSTLAFFLITNFAHWVMLYQVHTPVTLAECYWIALPFYKYKFFADIGWSAVLFGAYALATQKGWLPAVSVPPARVKQAA